MGRGHTTDSWKPETDWPPHPENSLEAGFAQGLPPRNPLLAFWPWAYSSAPRTGRLTPSAPKLVELGRAGPPFCLAAHRVVGALGVGAAALAEGHTGGSAQDVAFLALAALGTGQ